MSDTSTAITSAPVDRAPAFEGFPYLVTRIVSSLHHIILLPRSWDIQRLVDFAQKQVRANKLPTCLAFANDLCVYFQEDGSGYRSTDVPHGARIASEELAPAEPVPITEELAVRRMELILWEESQCGEGTTIIMGDLTKGGRMPTPEEEERLAGTHSGGVPKGLLPCPRCGEWRGECFDTLNRCLVVRVHCRCENDDRCADCGELLHERKLNANYFDPADKHIWHVPGFSAFSHRCRNGQLGCVSLMVRKGDSDESDKRLLTDMRPLR